MITDPGEVPPYWGFYMGDPESKRRRYCLMCHVFKPERCHHCSTCNRCVLNMDHHCPWINNCVGFHNRKYFLLLLMYVIISTYMITFGCLSTIHELILHIWQTRKINELKDLLIISSYTFNCLLAVVLSLFIRFHLTLVSRNSTTIENMDKTPLNQRRVYDRGFKRNWL
mmetsp:Transcript_33192/g.6008  ORF Transcript_33192/g.6008 Transcript_33192/m.6008 type:complete len:169 (+) Transcript_33192:198-704(+)